jgi:phospholipid transport system substrate-binding protein
MPKAVMWRAVALAAGLSVGALSTPGRAASPNGGDTVQGLDDALLSTMKAGRVLGQTGSFTQLEPSIIRSFEIASMARSALGPSCASLNDAQRRQMIESFGRYIAAIYANRLDSYNGQKLQVTGGQSVLLGVIVGSQIIKANGEPVEVGYLMQSGSSGSDIYVKRTVSEVATRRSEFAGILLRDRVVGLIAALNRKADTLTWTTASTLQRSGAGRDVVPLIPV